MGHYYSVGVIAVARSCYCISVINIAVIGLGFEITAFDKFADCSVHNSSAKVSACDSTIIVEIDAPIKSTICYQRTFGAQNFAVKYTAAYFAVVGW